MVDWDTLLDVRRVRQELGLTQAELADLIRADQVDVLVAGRDVGQRLDRALRDRGNVCGIRIRRDPVGPVPVRGVRQRRVQWQGPFRFG